MTTANKSNLAIKIIDVAIADTADTSAEINLVNQSVIAVYTDADWDGATFSFLVAPTKGGTFVPKRDGAGALYSKTIGASQHIELPAQDFIAMENFKIKSSASQSGGGTTLKIAVRSV